MIFLEFDSYYQGRIHIMDILFCMISAYFVYKYYISFHLQSYNSRGLEKILSWLLVWGDAPGAPTCGFIKYGSSLADHPGKLMRNPSFSTGNCLVFVFFSRSRPSQRALLKVVKLHHYVFSLCVCAMLLHKNKISEFLQFEDKMALLAAECIRCTTAKSPWSNN